MHWGAVKESVCHWCSARIYLVRVSINNWEWVTDLTRPPRATWKCYADAEWPAARLHQPVLLGRDADVVSEAMGRSWRISARKASHGAG